MQSLLPTAMEATRGRSRSTMTAMTITFADLPLEVRDRIYEVLFDKAWVRFPWEYNPQDPTISPAVNAIAFACKSFFAEVMPTFYRTAWFRFSFDFRDSVEEFENRAGKLSMIRNAAVSADALNYTGFDFETFGWSKLRDSLLSGLQKLVWLDVVVTCGCGSDGLFEHPSHHPLPGVSDADRVRRMIQNARSQNMDLSIQLELTDECYKTTSVVTLSSPMDFRIVAWTRHRSQHWWITNFLEGLGMGPSEIEAIMAPANQLDLDNTEEGSPRAESRAMNRDDENISRHRHRHQPPAGTEMTVLAPPIAPYR